MNFTNREATQQSGEILSFSFGQNWEKFLTVLNEERITAACQSIQKFTGLATLAGRTFLDVGCGSGLFSLAAYRLGASRVISMDIDPHSIECAHRLREREGAPVHWTIAQASALAMPVSKSSFDFVYSWGVLHHTGAMWQAIDHVADLVSPQGLFYLAIYRERRFSRQWLQVKRIYNRQNRLVKRIMILGYALFSITASGLNGQNPLRVIRDYGRTSRGMSWWRDIEDWLGGLPYEYTRPEKLIAFLKERGFECLHIPTIDEMEYLFARSVPATPRSQLGSGGQSF